MMMGMGSGMDKMDGAESMPALLALSTFILSYVEVVEGSGIEGLMAESAAQASKTPAEPDVEKLIEQISEI